MLLVHLNEHLLVIVLDLSLKININAEPTNLIVVKAGDVTNEKRI
tara:strand:+ start:254 stop:388 length:135 start_codon:yes stop_codon:yes gene_type:complete